MDGLLQSVFFILMATMAEQTKDSMGKYWSLISSKAIEPFESKTYLECSSTRWMHFQDIVLVLQGKLIKYFLIRSYKVDWIQSVND